MSIYAIGDLHLAKSIDKPMDIFGENWTDYMERIRGNWEEVIRDDDIVILPGDLSWGTYLKDVYEDFSFLENLPGQKIIFKGNHDYWWTTSKKIQEFCSENDFKTLNFLQNQSYTYDNVGICGTRGWIKSPTKEGIKIYKRELERLKLSISSIKDIENKHTIAALHYPPFDNEGNPNDFVDILTEYDIDICVYGHIHGKNYAAELPKKIGKTKFLLVSADLIDFVPVKLL